MITSEMIGKLNESGYKRGGVPWEEVLGSFSSTGRAEGVVVGGSGARLKFFVTKRAISVSEVADERETRSGLLPFRMYASLDSEGVLELAIYRKRIREGFKQEQKDFRTKEFILLALMHFKNQGYNIDKFKADWRQGEHNYEEFAKARLEGHDSVSAAKNTWTAKVMAEFGFTEVSEEDIVGDAGDTDMQVLFRKPLPA